MELKQDKIFKIKNVTFYLPHYPQDCISNCIVSGQNYWDNWPGGALGIIDNYLKDGANILDIGANIGSHTLYWSIERHAKKVYCFEPLTDTFEILKTNIRLNNLEKTVTLFNCGLSNETCKGSIKNYNESNIGGTSFEKSKKGDFEFKSLDSFNIPEKIDLMKIDVEGAEIDVLNGAIKTIQRDKPLIVIETFTHKKEVDSILNMLQYIHIKTIRNGEDYIYKYAGE